MPASILKNHGFSVLLLAVAILTSNLWIKHHLEPNHKLVIIIYTFAGVYGIMTFLLKASTKEEEENVHNFARSVILFFIRPEILGIMYLALAIAGSSFASIKVFADGAKGPMTVFIGKEGSNTVDTLALADQNSSLSIVRSTNPFGESFYIKINGYKRKSFELYPWTGKRIKVKKDLEPSPSLLIRLPEPPNKYIGYKLVILSEQDTMLNQQFDKSHNAFIIGQKLPIPDRWEIRWENYLVGKSYPLELRTKIQDGWMDPEHLELDESFSAGHKLFFHVYSRNQSLYLKEDFTISNSQFQQTLIQKK